MSVFITDIMKLPSMKEAKIVAGNIENKVVSSVTVLEAVQYEISADHSLKNKNYRSEIAITAFMNSSHSVEKQCEVILSLYQEGNVGIIIYYLGLIVKKLDKRLIKLANQLDFVLIIMPENRAELRYSDAISEIMEIIVKKRLEDTYFASELIERISHLNKNQRNINTVLRIVSDRTHCSLFIIDLESRILNIAEWPADRGLPVKDILNIYSKDKNAGEVITHIRKKDQIFWVFDSLISDHDGLKLYLLVVKEVDDLTVDICKQSTDVLKTYLNLWAENHGEIEVAQLVNSIIKDEPEKMRRIAEIINIDVSKLSYMYIFNIKGLEDSMHYEKQLIMAERVIKNYVLGFNNIFVTAIYEKDIIVFIDKEKEHIDENINKLITDLSNNQLDIYASIFERITTTTDAKTSYQLNLLYRDTAALIFKEKKVFNSSEINFAKTCEEICSLGEVEIINRKKVLSLLFKKKNGRIMLETLIVFMLDGEMNIEKTAEIMHFHKNSIKYRINCVKNIMGNNLYKMPYAYELYLASALERLFPSVELN